MDRIMALFDEWAAFLGGDSIYLTVIYKTLGALAGSFLIWLILKRLLKLLEKKIQNYEFIRINAEIFNVLHKTFFLVLVLLTGTYLIQLFNIQVLVHTFHAMLIMLLASPIRKFLNISIGYLRNNIAKKTKSKVDDIIFDLLIKFSGVFTYITASILALDMIGINVMPFVAGAGVAGIAIGFAAKDTLSNLIAGVLLIIDRPFEIGDRIEVWSAPTGSATWGDVIDIGLRATKIRTTDHIIIIIPNNEIMKRDIVNYTSISSKIRVRIDIGIGYDADTAKAKEIICQVANSVDWIMKDPAPKVVVRNFGESSVDLQARVWIADARKRMDTISAITDRVKEAFDREGIEIPYPKRDIMVHQVTA